MTRTRRLLSAAFAGGLLLAALAPAASAAEPTVEVIATGLDNPRGMAISPSGYLYVAEAGTGGDLICIDGPEGESCGGLSGAISQITRSGQRRVVTGLPSFAAPDGSGATGPSDISFQGQGKAFIPIDLGGDPANRTSFPAALRKAGWLASANVKTGKVGYVADVAGFEAANDPDDDGPDSNPYSVVAGPSRVVVADAGANALVDVKSNGRIRVLAVFPEQLVLAPPFLGLPAGTMIPVDAVPNTVVKGPDGAWYVGQLTGFPFVAGAAKVFRVPANGGTPRVVASGFTNIIDIAFDKAGRLLVLEISASGLLNGVDGRLSRVVGGVRTTILDEGLVAPAGLLVGPDGDIFVSNFGVMPGIGQVLHITE
jgi:hypothetical protein